MTGKSTSCTTQSEQVIVGNLPYDELERTSQSFKVETQGVDFDGRRPLTN